MDKKKAPKDGPNSYLDWVQEGKVELHVSGFRGELGLGRRNHSAGEVHSCVYRIRITQKQVGYVVHADEDDCVEALKMP